MALIYNSLEWSLKCNSDGDVLVGTLLGFFTRLSPTKECIMSARRVFTITLPRERLSEILNETRKPAVSGLSFDTLS